LVKYRRGVNNPDDARKSSTLFIPGINISLLNRKICQTATPLHQKEATIFLQFWSKKCGQVI